MLIIGSRYVTRAFGPTAEAWRCQRCGVVTPFALLGGRRFFTLFFVPLIPMEGEFRFARCPACGTRYQFPSGPPAIPAARARTAPGRRLLLGVGAGLLAVLLCAALGIAGAALGHPASHNRLLAPVSGQLDHLPDNMTVRRADLAVRDFTAEARLTNPYDGAEHGWDYGFLFRTTGAGEEYRLIVRSDQTWSLRLAPASAAGGLSQEIAAGRVPALDTAAAASNVLRLTVRDRAASFSVNGQPVADLDVGAHLASGDVALATAIVRGDAVAGKATRYADFAVLREP